MCKKLMFLVSLVLVLSLVNGVMGATVIYWDGGAGTTDWATDENWVGNVAPGNGTTNHQGTVNTTSVPGPIIDETLDVYSIAIGWSQGPCYLGIVGGADVTMSGGVTIGWNYSGNGTVNMSGGTVTTELYGLNIGQYTNTNGTLNMTGGTININASPYTLRLASNGGTAHVQLDGGTLNTPVIEFGSGTCSVDITGGMLVLDGNVTSLDSRVTAYGGSGSLVCTYISSEDCTEVTAIPEPITMALLGMGGLALLRRKHA